MPNRNGTGPEGKGSKTGRGLGTCGDGVSKGDKRGRGLGQGQGMSFRRNADEETNKDDKK